MGQISQKLYPTDRSLLKAQDLWQDHCQILLIMLLKEFIQLNVKMNIIIKNAKCKELNAMIATAFLN